ncbi:MAG: PAS-domain containing protein [Comamonas sp.]
MNLLRRPNRIWIATLIGVGMLVAVLASAHVARRHALETESDSVRRQLHLYAQSLAQRIDRYRTLPELLALDAELREAVSRPLDAAHVAALNAKLERANGASQASTLTLIDAHGTALAASNWRDAHSNVGVDYSFRPYVQQALARGQGDFYGIGITTGQPGYFLARAIEGEGGRVLGLVVIKIVLTALEQDWHGTPDIVLVSDVHDIIFLASRPGWRYRALAPLSARKRAELQQYRQYADQPLAPLRYASQQVFEGDSESVVARVLDPAVPGDLLWQSTVLEGTGWRVHLLHGTGAVAAAGRAAALAAAGIWLALSLLVLYLLQNRRLAALRQRSRQQLEAALQQHARELRTAQDGVVQAARGAHTGLSRDLEHLPQGVVVIDAALRLVAWNSRYLELFRYPSELVRVGRPIADLFRHNARRGLLGPGPIEEAIERRLGHLRSGKPHLHESEKGDGTVLEIRGNPLPDGGFVTSYADITSYKNAARELRSLADALEHRIAERTRDLDAARRQAEKANEYKTRFVSAAVHDLLQPLNAARMYLSGLRGHLESPPGPAATDAVALQYAGHIHHALAAQDAILTSLLDIARMESGHLPVQVRDFGLAPLMDTLLREFGMLAASHGLRLRGRAAHITVRSDEDLLRRILQNYLSNAVRYTRRGGILLGVRRRGGWLRIEVHDQGPGIPESRLDEIFEEFRRLDEGHGDDRGAGLGLAIVDRIGRLLGHPIGVSSQLGRGSVFWVEVPLGEAPQSAAARVSRPAPAIPASGTAVERVAGDPARGAPVAVQAVAAPSLADQPLRGTSAWCLDADAAARATACTLLGRWGCAVRFAGTPQAGLAAAVAAAGEARPELLLVDVDSLAAAGQGPAEAVDRLCAAWGDAPAVVLLAERRDDALRRCADERGWGLLAKPIRPPAMRALLSQVLLRRRL